MFDYTKKTGQTGALDPHPDGKAWPKCCKGMSDGLCCAFVPNQYGGPRINKKAKRRYFEGDGEIGGKPVSSIPFMCVHRSTDDGYHRVCAGWDACFGNKAITTREKSA